MAENKYKQTKADVFFAEWDLTRIMARVLYTVMAPSGWIPLLVFLRGFALSCLPCSCWFVCVHLLNLPSAVQQEWVKKLLSKMATRHTVPLMECWSEVASYSISSIISCDLGFQAAVWPGFQDSKILVHFLNPCDLVAYPALMKRAPTFCAF